MERDGICQTMLSKKDGMFSTSTFLFLFASKCLLRRLLQPSILGMPHHRSLSSQLFFSTQHPGATLYRHRLPFPQPRRSCDGRQRVAHSQIRALSNFIPGSRRWYDCPFPILRLYPETLWPTMRIRIERPFRPPMPFCPLGITFSIPRSRDGEEK